MRKPSAYPVFALSIILSMISIFPGSANSAQLRIGAAANYFVPSEAAYKDLYGSGGISPAGSLSVGALRRLEIRAEVAFFRDEGKMSLTQEGINLSLLTCVLSFRYGFIESKLLRPYAGAGFALISYQEEVPQRLTDVSESSTGFTAEAGTYINPTGRFFLDLNLSYLSAEAKPHVETVKLGGIRVGIGAGFRF